MAAWRSGRSLRERGRQAPTSAGGPVRWTALRASAASALPHLIEPLESCGSWTEVQDERCARTEKRTRGYRVLEPAHARDQKDQRGRTSDEHPGDDGIDRAQVRRRRSGAGHGAHQPAELGVAEADAPSRHQVLHEEERRNADCADDRARDRQPRRPGAQHHCGKDARVGDHVQDEPVLEVEVDDVDEDGEPQQVDDEPGAELLVGGERAESDGAECGREPALQPGPAITFARPGARGHGLLPCCRGPAQLLGDVPLVVEALLAFLVLEPFEPLQPDGEPAGTQTDEATGDGDAGDDQRRIHASTARRSALRTAPDGAILPVQISKLSTPCCRSISSPSLARCPVSSASVTTSMGRGRYRRSTTLHAGGSARGVNGSESRPTGVGLTTIAECAHVLAMALRSHGTVAMSPEPRRRSARLSAAAWRRAAMRRRSRGTRVSGGGTAAAAPPAPRTSGGR